jgi:hypothetical protein
MLALGVLVGCSGNKPAPAAREQPKAEAQKEEKPTLYTGKPCVLRMADLAQRWARDALPFHVESTVTSEANGQDGKATIWRGMFATPSRGTFKTFTCSGSHRSDQPAYGVTSTAESAYAPNVPGLMFQRFYLQTDSDEAYGVAQQHGGSGLLKKNPKQPVTYILDWDIKRRELVWGVMYGTGQADSKGVGVIDASRGTFLRGGK